ncbi:MAG: sucrose synthase [Candidatus Hydrogenedentota bacterium]
MDAMATPAFPQPMNTHYVDLVSPEAVEVVKRFFLSLRAENDTFFLMDQITERLKVFLEQENGLPATVAASLRRLFKGCQEIMLMGDYTYALIRPKIGVKRILRLHPEEPRMEEVSRGHYLEVRDTYVQGYELANRTGLTINFAPFFQDYPKVKQPDELGQGISLLNRHLSAQLYQDPRIFKRALVEFLQGCHMGAQNILISEYLSAPDSLLNAVETALPMLSDLPADTPFHKISHELRKLGFEPGWGNTTARIAETLGMLQQQLESPDPGRFERFLGRLPLIRHVVMVSPHGWFAQQDVMSRPDTGGQVTYVLDQARAIESYLCEQFENAGLDIAPQIVILTRLIPESEGTTCGQPRERVIGSQHSTIVRVPFRYEDGQTVQHWISRFKIWPYLETFASEARTVLLSEFQGKPDLIVGHYTDGNLVAHRLADDLGVTHCAAVHALEKTKYLFSDMHWADMEDDYHFSCHFTADLIAYNSADYIISSSFREIGGNEAEMGMFESYECFSMPGLYRVASGFDPQLARHNIVPPGVSEDHFYPFTNREQRADEIRQMLDTAFLAPEPGPESIGRLDNPDLPPIFAMSRLDRVKNLPGLVELFGGSKSLRSVANLVISSSLTDPGQSNDHEEIEVATRLHELIDQYDLHGHVRWRGCPLNKHEAAEAYRVMADHGGVFAQPAQLETFGLTVVEAMACGLPVVVTCFGGPSEIVEHEVSGEVINPNLQEDFAFALERIVSDRDKWLRYSEGGKKRVLEAYTWVSHARKIVRLSNVYSYWNYLEVMNRPALDQYIHTLYHTVFRPRAIAVLE